MVCSVGVSSDCFRFTNLWRAHLAWPRLLAFVYLALAAGMAVAADSRHLVIQNDNGGAVTARARQIAALKRDQIRLEIRGDYCMSSCTMYLSLPDVCVTPQTIFGFHGPSSPIYGVGLLPAEFDRWSRMIAAYYPEPIRSWYMTTGRNRTVGFYRYSGRELIRIGIRQCPTA